LGTNAIDGAAGSGGKPCAEEPTSCDKTPQNGLEYSFMQVAVDSSEGPAAGDIYVTQNRLNLVDIFSAEGRYLGQLTASTNGPFYSLQGIAVDSVGDVYLSIGFLVGNYPGVAKYVPTANPPVNADDKANFALEGYELAAELTAGTASSAGSLFVTSRKANTFATLKMDDETGAFTRFAEGFNAGQTIDPDTGNPILMENGTLAAEFAGSGPTSGAPLSLLRGDEGNVLSQIVADATGDIYAITTQSYKEGHVATYGAPAVVPTVNAAPASNITGTKATLQGTVNPSSLPVSDCFFEWGPTAQYGHKEACEGSIPVDSEDHPVHVRISGLTPNGTPYHFRLAATDEHGTEYSSDQIVTTAHMVVTDPADGIGSVTATLHGTIRPEGHEYNDCFFEWGRASTGSYEHVAPCSPSAAEIEPGFTAQAVAAELEELDPGTAYHFRLVTTNAEGTLEGEDEPFTTLGAPVINEVRALNATENSALLEAKVNPRGFHTTYRFEWGPTSSYGNIVPVKFEPSAGQGIAPVLATATLSDLAKGTVYHYRVVATSAAGTTASPDEELETLDACGLPEGRCFEMVSRGDPGPAAQPGRYLGFGQLELSSQASDVPGSVAYTVQGGYPDATKGAEVLYTATRGATGWESSQLSPPVNAQDQQQTSQAQPSEVYGLSSDLRCGVVGSNQRLTDDPVAGLIVEAGGANLYRRNPDGSYTLVTDLPPEELKSHGKIFQEFDLVGMSKDCGKIVFTTEHHYSGVPGTGARRLYEWDQSNGLRTIGWVPDGSGEGMVSADAGGSNAVSEDGSRVFFTAERIVAGNPVDGEEAGKQGLFVRESGRITRDVSASETAVPDEGASFQGATPDGSHVYFTANAGLTAKSNSTGTDLYEYDLKAGKLTDLTVTSRPGGADVVGVAGVSEDGSHVYFSSGNQLVPGQGKTQAQNERAGTESLYDVNGGSIKWVADGKLERLSGSEQSSRISPDGRYLLFEATGNVTGYESARPQAYLYDAQGGPEGVVCVSCRQDGKPTLNVATAASRPLSPIAKARSLVIRNGKPEVFFRSRDRLAEGAVNGEANLYEWVHGQVFHIASEVPGSAGVGEPEHAFVEFIGADSDGTDLYLADAAALTWENPGERPAVWDARVNGGFARPAAPSAPCDPGAEGSCQVTSPQPLAPGGAASAGFNGPGNVKPKTKKAKKKKHHPKKHHRKKHHSGKKHKTNSQQKRHASHDRRAGK
jgi:hypothetical protein